MSHFTVLVVTEEKPTDEILEKALAPFHEFECTGRDDEYVQNVDKLEEAWEEYKSSTSRKHKGPNGELVGAYDDQFYRDPTPEEQEKIGPFGGSGGGQGLNWSSRDWGDGLGYRTKVHFLPEGWEEVEVPTQEDLSFPEFIEDWYGYKPVEGNDEPDLAGENKYGYYRVVYGIVTEVVDRTNPNAKWDWWQVGGRWSGLFIPKAGIIEAKKGSPGLMGSQLNPNGVDVIRKGDIDFDRMRDDAGTKAGEEWDKVHAVIDPHLKGFVSWDQMRDKYPNKIDQARTEYHAQPLKKAISDHYNRTKDGLFSWITVEDYLCSREEYVDRARKRTGSTFAFLRDGEWHERGSMGWWACVSDEKEDWLDTYNKLLDEVPDDHWLCAVDCHI